MKKQIKGFTDLAKIVGHDQAELLIEKKFESQESFWRECEEGLEWDSENEVFINELGSF